VNGERQLSLWLYAGEEWSYYGNDKELILEIAKTLAS
jgi:hypothetical protein